MTSPGPLLIAHRGASRQAPENTLAAFRLAWEEGADGIEADFRLTSDRQIACIHDSSTRRTTGVDLNVAGTPYRVLRLLDAGNRRGTQWEGERIPLLAEVLEGLPAGKRLFLELKGGRELVAPVAALLARSAPATESLRILSFSPAILAGIKEVLPRLRTCLVAEWTSRADAVRLLKEAGAEGLALRAGEMVDHELVRLLHGAGKEIHVWTVNDARRARQFQQLGVDSIITDRPGYLRRVLSGQSLPTDGEP